jgi:multidrug efflux pump subunit AcrA (membrane-fusion protein)
MVLLAALAACSGPKAQPADTAPADAGGARVPVTLASARTMTFEQTVEAPGATQALFEHKIRAPYAGRLSRLRATDGAQVHRGQVMAELLSQESVAALSGAQAMAQAATSAPAKAEAARALALARSSAVSRVLSAPVDGVVLSHSASDGDLVAAGDELFTIADPKAIVFVAQVVQTDLPQIHAGQDVSVTLASRTQPVKGTVKTVLPSASSAALAAPVRIQLGTSPAGVGFFGTARIVTGTHPGAVGVPAAALLRDDVSGVTRIARVGKDGTAHWVEVTPGLAQAGWVELVGGGGPVPGESVIVGGQVGLPDGARVIGEP